MVNEAMSRKSIEWYNWLSELDQFNEFSHVFRALWSSSNSHFRKNQGFFQGGSLKLFNVLNKTVVITFRRSLSNASFKLNMRRRSRILAARRCAIDATRRRVFFVDPEPLPLLFGAGNAPRGDSRCDTKPPICDRGQSAAKMEMEIEIWRWKYSAFLTALRRVDEKEFFVWNNFLYLDQCMETP